MVLQRAGARFAHVRRCLGRVIQGGVIRAAFIVFIIRRRFGVRVHCRVRDIDTPNINTCIYKTGYSEGFQGYIEGLLGLLKCTGYTYVYIR